MTTLEEELELYRSKYKRTKELIPLILKDTKHIIDGVYEWDKIWDEVLIMDKEIYNDNLLDDVDSFNHMYVSVRDFTGVYDYITYYVIDGERHYRKTKHIEEDLCFEFDYIDLKVKYER